MHLNCPDGACLTCALVCFLHADFTNSYLEFRSGELPQKSDSSRFRVSGFGFRWSKPNLDAGFGFRVSGFGFRRLKPTFADRFRVSGFGFGFRVSGFVA